MFTLNADGRVLCDGVTRREAMRLGGLSLFGLSLPQVLRAAEKSSTARRDGGGRAKSCILFFMEGGPAQQDLWDMKPDAPVEYRGEFKPISTTVPGVQVCEYLPRLARQMHHVALIRSVHHAIIDHNASTYFMLTGRYPLNNGQLVTAPAPSLFPPYGSVLAKLRPSGTPLPDFVHLPALLSNLGSDLPAQTAGFLGGAFDPYVAGDPSLDGYVPPGLSLAKGVTPARLARRKSFLSRLNRTLGALADSPQVGALREHQRRAFELIGSREARDAFDLSHEPAALREKYGFDRKADRSKQARQFGGLPHLGQCMLMARRLVEAGVGLVTVCAGRRYCQSFDGHRQHFPLMRQSLLPMTDQAFPTLLEDLSDRGLLDETLVVAMGEFGRTPKVGQIISSAGATPDGRDHWPFCFTVLMAGAGITGGAVYGASDKYAAYPQEDPVTPGDIAATIYYALGIDPATEIRDPLDRPLPIAEGKPITALWS